LKVRSKIKLSGPSSLN